MAKRRVDVGFLILSDLFGKFLLELLGFFSELKAVVVKPIDALILHSVMADIQKISTNRPSSSNETTAKFILLLSMISVILQVPLLPEQK